MLHYLTVHFGIKVEHSSLLFPSFIVVVGGKDQSHKLYLTYRTVSATTLTKKSFTGILVI